MDEKALTRLYDYMVTIRRQLHGYPEVGFDLPRTCALVESELSQMGIMPSKNYGTCCLVAEIGQGDTTIALRADMDALPVEEKTELPYRSRIPGCMHACGHDTHTAILLAVAKYLKERESQLRCKVRLIFQSAEECAISGAKMMVDLGVMKNVDQVLCAHCDNTIPTGFIGICPGDYMAACVPLTITFLGKTSHATLPQFGVDANAMAVEAYQALKQAIQDLAGTRPYIWSVGRISGGQAHNVISDRCTMDISFRFYSMELARRMETKTRQICDQIAAKFGGTAEIDWHMSTGPVRNDPAITAQFRDAALAAGLDVQSMQPRMSSEDFAWYLTKVPGMIFRFGTRNEALGCTGSAHSNDFMPDEQGMAYALRAFCAFVMK